ncbi:hypothetical protein V3C99_011172 [Haemonchus contortus]
MLLTLVSGILIFLVLVFCTFLPYCYLVRRNRIDDRGINSLSICNCVACGIFLSTCFLGLIPHVRHHEELIRAGWRKTAKENVSNSSDAEERSLFLNTESVVLLGFLVILIIEQVVHTFSAEKTSSKNSPNRGDALPSLRSLLEGEDEDGQPLVDTTLDDHDDHVQDIVFRSSSPMDCGPHHAGHGHAASADGISARTLFLLFGLSTHSFFEGIALGVQHDKEDFMNILIAVMFHEVLCCVAYGVSMAQQHTPVRAALPTVLILSASIPSGMITALLVDQINSNSLMLRFVLEGLAGGVFVYVACVEMLSVELGHSQGHSHTGGHGHINGHGPQPSPYQGLVKAAAVVSGVLLFLGLKIARGRHF